jgi:hypothetical protein
MHFLKDGISINQIKLYGSNHANCQFNLKRHHYELSREKDGLSEIAKLIHLHHKGLASEMKFGILFEERRND